MITCKQNYNVMKYSEYYAQTLNLGKIPIQYYEWIEIFNRGKNDS